MSKASELATLAKAGTRALASDWAHWALGGMAAPPECGAPSRTRQGSPMRQEVASCGVALRAGLEGALPASRAHRPCPGRLSR